LFSNCEFRREWGEFYQPFIPIHGDKLLLLRSHPLSRESVSVCPEYWEKMDSVAETLKILSHKNYSVSRR
jgi:hypothetical protein